MSLALKAKQIRCPECGHDGRTKTEGTDIGLWAILAILLLLSLLIWPLVIPAAVIFFWLLSKPSKRICPKCDYEEKSSS